MKTQSYIYRCLLLVFGFFLNASILFAQNCNQNNVTVERFELRDVNGNPFTSADDYQLGEEVSGTLYVILGGSNSGNAYSTVAFFNILINETPVSGRQRACLSELVNPQFGTAIFASDLTWNWGDKVTLNGLLVRWFTNGNEGNTCNQITEDTNKSAQCFASPDDIEAEIPVVPNLDFDAETCNPTVDFINQTIGGKPPYTYAWNFDGYGTSIEANPTFTFPGIDSYEVTLSVTDADDITNTITKTITIPAIEIEIEVTPTRINESTGSILVQPSGGTGPYTVEWISTDPEGISGTVTGVDNTYLIDNLPFGNYEVSVTDSQGCPGFVETFIDIATILFSRWGGLEVTLKEDQAGVSLDWFTETEGDPGVFQIERADNPDLDFYNVAEIKSSGFSDNPIWYSHVDTELPSQGGRIYYRINYIVNNEIDVFSDLVSIVIEASEEAVHFNTYPNPTTGEKLTLRLHNHRALHNKEITVSLFSANYFVNKEMIVQGQFIELGDLIRPFPKGVIILQLRGEGIHQNIKVMKK
ncbi:PKD domain-containing protein [Mongoliibacter ruber]|uniref:SprB-like repeat protein n=1 Tax=Mongoliibacter ruber TaxID=1750599 RepID=A0A2T0WV00_9BACT|nr:PKD domain-containing protein [Mongoliibacter ruber]PRY90499.1 SprB-like repeat protein [Mongoliibacter ruber]